MKVDAYSIKKQMPNLYLKDQIYMKESDGDQMSEESDIGKYEKLFTPPKVRKQKNTLAVKKMAKIETEKLSKTREDE